MIRTVFGIMTDKTPNEKDDIVGINRRKFLVSTGAVAGLGAVGSIPVQAQQDRTTLGKALFSQLIVHYDIDDIRTPSHTDQVSFFQKRDNELYVPVISEGDAETIQNNDSVLVTNKLNSLPAVVNRGSSDYLTVKKTDYHQPVQSVRIQKSVVTPSIRVESQRSGSLGVSVGARHMNVDSDETKTMELDPKPVKLDKVNRPNEDSNAERKAKPVVTVENYGTLKITATKIRR